MKNNINQLEANTGQATFWSELGGAMLVAGRAVGAGATAVGRSAADAYRFVDPDLRRQLFQAPILGLMGLAPTSETALSAPGDDVDAATTDEPVVLLVHGLGGQPAHFVAMQRYLRHIGDRRSHAVDLRGADCLEEKAQLLRSAIAVHSESARKVDIVTHSMGGIVARLALEEPEFRARVATLVTMATPHKGTHLARLADTPCTLDLRPGSSMIERLNAQDFWDDHDTPRLIALWSRADTTILPSTSAAWSAATTHQMVDYTHLSYLVSPSSWRFLVHILRTPSYELANG